MADLRLPLPPGIKDTRFETFAQLAEEELGRIEERVPALVTIRVATVTDAGILGLLAWQWHVMGLEGWDAVADLDLDLRRGLIASALELHRYKGTPWAVRTALQRALKLDVILEEDTPVRGLGDRWATWQIDPGRVLARSEAAAAVAIANTWAPARSKLIRLYHGWDDRAVTPSGRPRFGRAILGNDSGARLDGVRQSFGIRRGFAVPGTTPADVDAGATLVQGMRSVYRSQLRLGVWRFSERTVRVGDSATTLRVGLSGAPLAAELGRIGAPHRLVARAAIVLSGGERLGTHNARFGASRRVEVGGPMVLNRNRLSGYRHSVTAVGLDEVFETRADAFTAAAELPAGAATATVIQSAEGRLALAWPTLSGRPATRRRNAPSGQTAIIGSITAPWTARWPQTPWPPERTWTEWAWVGSTAATVIVGATGEPPAVASGAFVAVLAVSAQGEPTDALGDVGAGVGADAVGEPYRALWPTSRWGRHTWSDPVGGFGATLEEGP